MLDKLATFLLAAKRHTYAGLDDDATVAVPLIGGSKQLEFRAHPFAYRDIYFGMSFFVGLETVSEAEKPLWSMCYSGGVQSDVADKARVLSIYKFLRRALLAGRVDLPYRGPETFDLDGMTYRNMVTGTLENFQGEEEITSTGQTVYRLRYGGGMLR